MQKINARHILYILPTTLGLLLVVSNNLVLIMFGTALISLTIVYNMAHSMNAGIGVLFHSILGLCAIVAGDFFSSLFGLTTTGMILILGCMTPFIIVSGKTTACKVDGLFYFIRHIIYISNDARHEFK